jgi:ribosomal protein L11 methyltransferase
MSWLQLSVAVPRDLADAAGACLEAHGAVAVSLSGASDDVLLEPSPGEQPLWDQVRLQALLEPHADLKALRTALAGAGARVIDAGFLADDDWQSRWRAHAVRACFSGRLWLLPRDEPVAAPARENAPAPAVLRLDPGLAFGSGSHPTTRLCLSALASAPPAGLRVLDYGCGSGVLALAACLLGAREVAAVDHDPQALLATRDNATYNHVGADRLRVVAPQELKAPPEAGAFDVVVANILANPLVALAPRLTALTAAGGRLLLSGLLGDQEQMIRDAYPLMTFGPPAHEAEWICLDGRRQRTRGA